LKGGTVWLALFVGAGAAAELGIWDRPPPMQLPTGRWAGGRRVLDPPRPPVFSYFGATLSLRLEFL